MKPTVERICPACQSSELVEGASAYHGNAFTLRSVGGTWFAYPVPCHLCLTCGLLSHFMDAEQLAKLRQKLHREAALQDATQFPPH